MHSRIFQIECANIDDASRNDEIEWLMDTNFGDVCK